MGGLTHSKLDRAVIARYFAFLIISQLIIFTLLGVIFSELMSDNDDSASYVYRRFRAANRDSNRQEGELQRNS